MIKDPETGRLPWIIQWALKAITGIPVREAEGENYHRKGGKLGGGEGNVIRGQGYKPRKWVLSWSPEKELALPTA